MGFNIFEDYSNGKYIPSYEFEPLKNYIAGQLTGDWSPNKGYYYQWYNESNNIYQVLQWRRANGFQPVAKYGERICTTLSKSGALIDLTESKHASHFEICYSCSKLREG